MNKNEKPKYWYKPGLIETQALEIWALNNRYFVNQTNINDVWAKETDEGVCFTLIGGKNCGMKLSGFISCDSEGYRIGIHEGHLNFPVPIAMPGTMLYAVAMSVFSRIKGLRERFEKKLLFLDETPFFKIGQETGRMVHADGWYMNDDFMYEFSIAEVFWNDSEPISEFWGVGTRFFRLRCFVYVLFPDQPDGSRNYRLVPVREFFDLRQYVCDETRRHQIEFTNQGDCWIFKVKKRENIEYENEIEVREDKKEFDFHGHKITTRNCEKITFKLWNVQDFPFDGNTPGWIMVDGPAILRHDRHETVDLNYDGYVYILKMAPGTSHPFQIGVND